ncbi:LysM peptidoglycan-binding domain-containing protein [Lactiplantibacillus pingfangensis]|uniref:aggregation-promoting factor n=1 Tax=Lactiplantibacillus pingfangensis TaxID=2559915 RepID=UPI0010F8AC91|nr:LysM domain-containing protein [Lactiplantibacillus pingfangensis]
MKVKNIVLSTVAALGLFTIATTTANADTVTVKAGDTVAKIASEHQTTINAIEKANNLKNVNLIFVGDQLEVNGSTTATTATNTAAASTTATTNNTTSENTASTTSQNTTTTSTETTTSTTTNDSDSAAKAWIANQESGGSYTATNGQYIGKYQLSSSYLNGDYSAANQEKVADNYVASRYGSWSAAKAHWLANNWY